MLKPLPSDLPVDVFLNHSHQRVGQLTLKGQAQPGSYLHIEDQSYQVLERRHRYLFQDGAYQLYKITLYVQKVQPWPSIEWSLWENRWVLGNSQCIYNAHSELLRCAVNPSGPCQGCPDYQALSNSKA